VLVVTTAHDAGPAQHARAETIAQRLSAPVVVRKALADLAKDGATLVYVVRVSRDELIDLTTGATTHVQPGMLPQKRTQGRHHPLIRALGSAKRVLDGTAGLLNDALHAAELMPCEVMACEASPVVACLAEEGLRRLRQSTDSALAAAAHRVSLRAERCEHVLSTLSPGDIDAVMLDPMMVRPRKASPAFSLMRVIADYAPAEATLIAGARRVAPLVVLKLGRGVSVPVGTERWFRRHEAGRQVTYWVAEG
jgi:hypothetical protein